MTLSITRNQIGGRIWIIHAACFWLLCIKVNCCAALDTGRETTTSEQEFTVQTRRRRSALAFPLFFRLEWLKHPLFTSLNSKWGRLYCRLLQLFLAIVISAYQVIDIEKKWVEKWVRLIACRRRRRCCARFNSPTAENTKRAAAAASNDWVGQESEFTNLMGVVWVFYECVYTHQTNKNTI